MPPLRKFWYLFVFLLLIPVFAGLNLRGTDFDEQFYQAGRGWVDIYGAVPLRPLATGGNYGIFLPWAIALIQPITLLPLEWARAIIQSATVVALGLLAGPRPIAWLFTFSSAPTLLLITYYANLDAVAALGLFLPPVGGVLLLAIKPQAVGLAALVWLAHGRWRAFAPLGMVVGLSTLLWSEWIYRLRDSSAGALNVSLFPYSLLLAIPLLILAIRRKDLLLAALATPLAVPYVAHYSLAPIIALLARRHWLLGLVATVSSWGVLWLLMQRLAELRTP
jgi:hypothetical protein